MSEIWRDIPGFPNHQASSNGRIRRSTRGGGVPIGHILKQRERDSGYMAVSLSGRKHFVHRLVCLAFHGLPPLGLQVSHENGDRSDNTSANLRWRSPKENNALKREHGTFLAGEDCQAAKLNAYQVITIRSAYRLGWGTHESLGKFFGVSRGTVGDLINGRTWRHVE